MRKTRIRSTGRGFRNPFAGVIGGPIFAIIGLVAAYFGWGAYSEARSFVAEAGRADGKIVQLVEKTSRDKDGNVSTLFFPVIDFTTADGQAIHYQSSTGSNPPAGQVGETVEILYDKQTPSDARTNSFTGVWLWPAVLLGIGGLFVLIGIGAFLQSLALILGLGGILALLFFWRKKAAEEPANQAPGA